MSNHPNMGHCQFENTARALDQLIATLENARSYRDLNLNEYEASAFGELEEKCERVIELIAEAEQGRWNEETYSSVEEIGDAAAPMPQDVLEGLDNTALKQVRDLAGEAQNGASDDDLAYFDLLAGACDDLLAERRS